MSDTDQNNEQDPLAPEPESNADDNTVQELYPDKDPLETVQDGADLQAVITGLQDELDKAKDQMIRAVAEAENTRKRAAKERQDASKYAISGFAKDLLAVADNLRRAIEAAPEASEQENLQGLIGGIEATERELLKSFEKNGITKLIPEDGAIFDPNIHEVMFEAPVPGKQAGAIMQVIEPGYMLHDRLLKPARVGVVKDDGSGTPPPETVHIDTEA